MKPKNASIHGNPVCYENMVIWQNEALPRSIRKIFCNREQLSWVLQSEQELTIWRHEEVF